MFTEREFLERARLDQRTLSVWIKEEWVIPGGGADAPAFTDMDLARANLIRDLKDKMGVNHEGLAWSCIFWIRCMRSDARSRRAGVRAGSRPSSER